MCQDIPPLNPSGAGDHYFTSGLHIAIFLRVPLHPGVAQVGAAAVAILLQHQTGHGERLCAKTGRQVLQGGQVFVHDLLGAQLALADGVLLEGQHKLGEDTANAQLGEEVVPRDVPGEGAGDAAQVAGRKKRNQAGRQCVVKIAPDLHFYLNWSFSVYFHWARLMI